MDLFDTYIDPGLKFIKKEAIQGMDAVCLSPSHPHISAENVHVLGAWCSNGEHFITCTCTCRQSDIAKFCSSYEVSLVVVEINDVCVPLSGGHQSCSHAVRPPPILAVLREEPCGHQDGRRQAPPPHLHGLCLCLCVEYGRESGGEEHGRL